jgi:valyl-tRNA synthetase
MTRGRGVRPGGLDRFAARKAVLQKLEEQGLLVQ